MQDVLLVLADPVRRATVSVLLQAAGLPVLAAEGGLHALTQIERVRPAAILTDDAPGDLSAEELHEIVRSEPDTASLPFLLLSERTPGWLNTPQDRALEPWRSSSELADALASALPGAPGAPRPVQLHGTLESVGLFELAGTISAMRKTGCLGVRHAERESLIMLRGGDITHGEYSGVHGEDALLRTFSAVHNAPQAHFHFERLPTELGERVPQTIHTPTERLLLELAVHLDHATHF